MKTISRYIMTLALLLTAVTGAWAEETPLVTINASSDFQSGSKTFDNIATVTLDGNFYGSTDWSGNGTITVTPANDGVTITSVKFSSGLWTIEDTTAPFQASQAYDSNESHEVFDVDGNKGHWSVAKIEVYGTAEAPITVEPGSSANTWTFSMPGSDVVLTPIYANAATFATTGTEPEVKTLLPEAAEGVIAGTDASLIAEGTGIVANIGETTTAQGTLMYAVGTSATQAPALTAFSTTAPTAKDYDDAATVYVWYYIKGANAPQGEAATLDNTFDDTEPACLPVTVLTNKFDITLKAANANTIEAGKATVTVGGQPATVTDGKLKAVKMGSEVKLEANPGYKFRKVEVKKTVAATISFTVMRATAGGNNSVTYTVDAGTTWQQFIESGNAPASLSIGTSGSYSGKVCHDMDGGVTCCGGTLIANVADKKRVKASDAIIDGATYGCSDYCNYEDHD